VYSENVRLKTTADLHQILLKLGGKNAMKTSEILRVASGKQKIGRKIYQWFSKFNRDIPLSKTPNVYNFQQQENQTKMWIK
jgi:hypothetical protein